jgi:hypothetical protein
MTTSATRRRRPAAYLVGVQDGWHAIHPDVLALAAATGDGIKIAQALCGRLVRYAPKYRAYTRDTRPVTFDPCPECAWAVAVATGATAREIQLILPDAPQSEVLRRNAIDPLLPAALCRAILAAAEGDPSEPEVIRQLAAVTRHQPGVAVSEDCADGGCSHHPCTYPDGRAVCWACSLRAGDEAGEWAGQIMPECAVAAPCGAWSALAGYYQLAVTLR